MYNQSSIVVPTPQTKQINTVNYCEKCTHYKLDAHFSIAFRGFNYSSTLGHVVPSLNRLRVDCVAVSLVRCNTPHRDVTGFVPFFLHVTPAATARLMTVDFDVKIVSIGLVRNTMMTKVCANGEKCHPFGRLPGVQMPDGIFM